MGFVALIVKERRRLAWHVEGSGVLFVELTPDTGVTCSVGVWMHDMKFWKVFGGLLTFFGCVLALAGILATAAPMVDNDQMRLIIEAFSLKSTDPMLNMVNGVILWCLHNNYLLFGLGIAVLLAGGLIKTIASRALSQNVNPNEKAKAATASVNRQRAAQPPRKSANTVETAYAHKTAPGTSPYAAAQYGKALATGSAGSDASDIARKYLPKSIISTDALPEETYAQPVQEREPAIRNAQSVPPVSNGISAAAEQRAGVIVCPNCGQDNPVNLVFCTQCGEKLPARLSILASESKREALIASGLADRSEYPASGDRPAVAGSDGWSSVQQEQNVALQHTEPSPYQRGESRNPTYENPGAGNDRGSALPGASAPGGGFAQTVYDRPTVLAPGVQIENTPIPASQTAHWNPTGWDNRITNDPPYAASSRPNDTEPQSSSTNRGTVQFYRPAMDAMATDNHLYTNGLQNKAEATVNTPPATAPQTVQTPYAQSEHAAYADFAAQKPTAARASSVSYTSDTFRGAQGAKPRIVSTFRHMPAIGAQTPEQNTRLAGDSAIHPDTEATLAQTGEAAPKPQHGPRIVSTMGKKTW